MSKPESQTARPWDWQVERARLTMEADLLDRASRFWLTDPETARNWQSEVKRMLKLASHRQEPKT